MRRRGVLARPGGPTAAVPATFTATATTITAPVATAVSATATAIARASTPRAATAATAGRSVLIADAPNPAGAFGEIAGAGSHRLDRL